MDRNRSIDRIKFEDGPIQQTARSQTRGHETRETILDAAQLILRQEGFVRLSTRKVAAEAGVPLSQIHYHFGSKEGLVLALLDHLDAQAFGRQRGMYDADLPLSKRWDQACDFLDQDLASGYVRLLHECIAQGWSNEAVAAKLRGLLYRWQALLKEVAEQAVSQFGALGPFTADDIAQLVGMSFIGAETELLLGIDEQRMPIRSSLRKFGVLIEWLESQEGRMS